MIVIMFRHYYNGNQKYSKTTSTATVNLLARERPGFFYPLERPVQLLAPEAQIRGVQAAQKTTKKTTRRLRAQI